MRPISGREAYQIMSARRQAAPSLSPTAADGIVAPFELFAMFAALRAFLAPLLFDRALAINRRRFPIDWNKGCHATEFRRVGSELHLLTIVPASGRRQPHV